MKRSKFTEEQIAFALGQADTGTKVPEICRQLGVSAATFYAWRKKYGGLGIADVRRLKQLESENRRLKQLVADLSLDKEMLQEVTKKSCEAGAEARARRIPRRHLCSEFPPRDRPTGSESFHLLLQAASS